MIFGNRNIKSDFFYRSEWESYKTNLKLITAFSRDQKEKIYVQHRIIENGPFLWKMIHEKQAVIYLSGNAKQIPAQVSDALETVFEQNGNLTKQEAKDLLKKLEKNHKFQKECWS